MNKIKLIIVIFFLVSIYFYYQNSFFEDENIDVNTKQVPEVKQNKQIKEKLSIQKKNPSYKDIFVESKKQNILKKYQEEKDIEQLDKKVDNLLKEADSFIEENNIKPSKKELSIKEKKELEDFQKKIKNLEIQLEELGDEEK